MRLLLAVGALLLVGLSGCFGFDPAMGGYDDFAPGQDVKPTGRTVHLEATVVDWVFHEVYPGFMANMWAFCFRPATAGDEVAEEAIEYWNTMESDGVNAPGFEQHQWRCSVPGPTIRVQQGDLVKVDFKNDHFHCHTIHWHGQHVPWQDDGAPGVNQESVCRGTSFSYEFVAKRAGSLWYHCHVDTHFHVMQGLYGAFIVEPQDDTWEPKDIDEEYVLVYSSLSRDLVQVNKARVEDPHAEHQALPGGCGETGAQGCQNPPVDVSPDTWLLNGRSLPHTMMDNRSIVRLDEGDRVRLRLFNFGETHETIHTHGHDMYVTHRDGNPLPPQARFYVDTLTIGPAERYDVVIEGNNPGLWMMHTHTDHQATNDHMAPGGAMSMIVYRSVEEEQGTMMPYAVGAELPGGLLYAEPMAIPPDAYDNARARVQGVAPQPNVGTTVDVDVPIEINVPCALRSLTVQATFSSDLPREFTQPEGLTLTMQDESGGTLEGTEMVRFRTDGTLVVTWQPTDSDGRVVWKDGNHTLHLGGAINGYGDVELDWSFDYFTNDELRSAKRSLAGTECDPQKRLVDYIAFAKSLTPSKWPDESLWPPKPETP